MSAPLASWSRRVGEWGRRWGRLACFVLTVAAVIGAHLGCADPVQRYRTLSFFFDGVPVPEALRDEVAASGQPIEPWRTAQRAAERPPAPEPQRFYYHAPYATRNCFGCHDQAQGYDQMVGGDSSVCQRCHQEYFEREVRDWVHGPVVLGQCRQCHLPHKSEHEHLVEQPQPTLCYHCHSERYIETDPFHGPLEDKTCSRCHDPHAAGNRLLLTDARTYARRRGDGLTPLSEHPAWQAEQCSLCHQPDRANQLVHNVDQVCLKCHGELVDPPAPGLHPPVAEARCTACHTPHKSPRPNLIHPTAEALCLSCHELEALDPSHPKVSRVDCLMCHRGHASDREALLRAGVGLAADPTVAWPTTPSGPAPPATGGTP